MFRECNEGNRVSYLLVLLFVQLKEKLFILHQTKSFLWDKDKETPYYIRVPKKVQGRVLAIQKWTFNKLSAFKRGITMGNCC